MFRRIIANNPTDRVARANELFRLHPSQISALLETAWSLRTKNGQAGSPDNRIDISDIPSSILALFNPVTQKNFSTIGVGNVGWDHLIYAYLIENTSIVEVFKKVIVEYLHGEKLGSPMDLDTQAWLRNTEALFFSTQSPFSVINTQSILRPDPNAYRRNAYQRMFGMDLNHGLENGQPYPYIKAEAANNSFVDTLEPLQYEISVGIANFGNSSGVNRTDDAAIANMATQLNSMLLTRRQNGNLSQVEFNAVAMMSWFHLSLEFDSPIVKSLRAEGSSEDQRLFKIAEKTGMKAHSKAYDFFRLADPLSRFLTQIEMGIYNDPNAVPALYQQPGAVAADMRTIITHWSAATGRDMKVPRGKNLTTVTPPNLAGANGVGQEAYLN